MNQKQTAMLSIVESVSDGFEHSVFVAECCDRLLVSKEAATNCRTCDNKVVSRELKNKQEMVDWILAHKMC